MSAAAFEARTQAYAPELAPASQSSDRLFGFVFFACLALLAATALLTDLFFFADGAFFAFAIASGHYLDWVVLNYPQRAGALLFSGAPGLLAHALGASHFWVGKVFQLGPLLVSLCAYLSIGAFAPDAEGAALRRWSLLSLAALGMSTFGFPTETWSSCAWVWPALASLIRPPRGAALWLFAALVAGLLVFSHEGALLCMPFLAAHGLRGWREFPRERVRLFGLMGVYVALIVADWLLVWGWRPENPAVVAAIANNKHETAWGVLRHAPLLATGCELFAVAILQTIFPRFLEDRLARGMVIALVIGSALYCVGFDNISGRYHARTGILLMIPAALFVLAFFRRPPPPKAWLLAPALAASLILTADFVWRWTSYANFLVAQTRNGEPIDEVAWVRGPLSGEASRARAFYMDFAWTAPYAAMMLRDREFEPLLSPFRRDYERFAPLTCPQARAALVGSGWLAPSSAAALAERTCLDNPG